MVNAIKKRYLTKTRFKLAVECPSKFFYAGKSKVYADTKQGNDFLNELAEIQALLRRNSVTIFEAAVRHETLFIRADVLRNTGKQLELIELKAKSFWSNDINSFVSTLRRAINR